MKNSNQQFKITISTLAIIFIGFFQSAQALTYDEIYQYQTHGQILGASTISLVQNPSVTGSHLTLSQATGSGNLLVVAINVAGSGVAITGVSDNATGGSNTYVGASNSFASASNGKTQIWYAANSKAGATFVNVTTTGSIQGIDVVLLEYSGVDTISPLDVAAAKNNGSSSASPVGPSITTTTAGDVVVASVLYAGGITGANSPYTIESTTNGDGVADHITTNTVTNEQVTFVGNSGAYAIAAAAFKPAVSGGGDVTAPSIPANLSATAQSSSSINLSWSASSDDTAVTGYTIYQNGSAVTTTSNTSYSDTGLTASTQYSYTVDAFDAAGNHSSQSTSANATTQAPASDTTAPSTPTNLSATAVSSSAINLSWTASTDNVGVSGYKIFRGGVQVGTSVGTFYSDSGLAVSTLYTYTVSAYDAASNSSSQSSSASATTQAQAGGGTNFYVRSGATGNGSGSDWTNAYTSLPATLQRGATYYVASGSYAGRTFNTAVSGALLITIQGATAASHGTDIGWSNSYSVSAQDGGSAARWTGMLTFTTSYWVFDGSVGSALDNTPANYGFSFGTGLSQALLIGTAGSSGGCGSAVSNLTFAHFYGKATTADVEKEFEEGNTYGGVLSNITFSNFLIDGWQGLFMTKSGGCSSTPYTGWIVQYGVMLNGFSSSANHGEWINPNERAISGLIVRYCIFRGSSGSAGMTGTIVANNSDNTGAQIYGNVFDSLVVGNGVISGTSEGNFNNAVVYNNTFINDDVATGNPIGGSGQGTGNIAYNNLFYNMNASAGGGFTLDYNTYYSTTNSPTEVHKQTGSGNPFVNLASYNYQLAAATQAGSTLSSPYNVDSTGATRGGDGTWDRGAYEFSSGGSTPPPDTTPPAAPTGVGVN